MNKIALWNISGNYLYAYVLLQEKNGRIWKWADRKKGAAQ